MVKATVCITVVLAAFHICHGLKILTIFPYPVNSHHNLGSGLNRHLLNAGHEVTYITAFIDKNTHPNLRQIDVSSNLDLVPEDQMSISKQRDSSASLAMSHIIMMAGFHVMNKMTVQKENVQNLLRDPNEHFDAVIVDWNINDITMSGIAKLYNAPLIWLCTLDPHWLVTDSIDEALHPAYSSDIMAPTTLPLTFWQRAMELWTQLKVTFYKEVILYFFDSYLYNNEIAPIMKERGMEPPPAEELRYNASLVISNSHVSFGEAHRLPVNFIAVGGFHIDEDLKPLTGDLKNIMDNAKHGVIYFSLGSMIKSKDLPEDVTQAVIDMFGKLKQTVIWKFEVDRTNLPKNVHMVKWAPQQSILAHPNCVLFITHGGLLSTVEAIHYGVPIIGMPVFVDQFPNIDRAVSKGFAKKVDLVLSPTLAENLKEAIEDILSNPKYRENVKQLSFIFHHRPVKPGAELVHWVEHVIKTRGALHMRSPALQVSWYQKMYLDLLAAIISLVIGVKYIYKYISKVLFKTDTVKKKIN